MSGGKNKKALRRCQVCQRVGHNRSTCPERSFSAAAATPAPQKNTPSTPAPLKFFVHHTTLPTTESNHKLNLREHVPTVWASVTAAAPKKISNPGYYFPAARTTTPQPTALVEVLPHHKTAEEFSDQEKILAAAIARDTTPVHILYERTRIRDRFFGIVSTVKNFFARVTARPKKLRIITKSEPAFTEPVFTEKRTTPGLASRLERFFASLAWRRGLYTAAGMAVLLLLIAPISAYVGSLKRFKSTVQNEAMSGFFALKESLGSITSAEWTQAHEKNAAALNHFSAALTELQSNHRTLQTVATGLPVINTSVVGRQKLLLAGQALALGNEHILSELAALPENADSGEKFLALARGTESASDLYKQAITLLSEVDPKSIPTEYRDTFINYRALLNRALTDLTQLHSVAQLVPDVFGSEGRRRYLLVFQNPFEIRATGGFLGSFAFLEMYNGKMVKLDVPAGGSYDLQGQLSEVVEPPAPLLLANRRWEFQDANWFPDFPESAKKIAWFYRHSRGISVDGVIAVNANVLPKLLSLFGPVDDVRRGVTFTADTAVTDLQNIVERGAEKATHKPKAVISDLTKILSERITTLKDPKELATLAFILQESLATKDIQLAFFDSRLAGIVRDLGWDGAVLPTLPNQDYLLVSNTNIQGQKSDARMTQAVSHEAVVHDDGSIAVTVTITRTHTGDANEPDYGATNISYVRTYVPLGSELIKAEGFSWPDENAFRAPLSNAAEDTDLLALEKLVGTDPDTGTHVLTSFGKTVFSNWMITEPGKTTTAVLTYRLPFTLPLTTASGIVKNNPPVSYQLVVQKQSGVIGTFDTRVIFPNTFSTLWVDGPSAIAAQNGLTSTPATLTKDTVFSLLIRHQ